MAANPKISVVTVVFNDKRGLERTIQSVVNQTYSNIEYIIIDGGSTDGTIEIIKKYEDRIDYWVSEPDSGIYDAMNKGIDAATGDFVIFMNAGDEFYEAITLEKVVKSIKDKNKVYFGRARNIENKGTWLYPNRYFNLLNIDTWLKDKLPNHQTMFFPKAFYKKEKYNLNFKIVGDSDYKFRAYRQCGFQFIDEIVCNFDIGGVSSSFNSWKRTKTIMKESWMVSKSYRTMFSGLTIQIKLLIKYILSKLKVDYRRVDNG